MSSTQLAEDKGGVKVIDGMPSPMVEATTLSSLPFAPTAMTDDAEFNNAVRRLVSD